MVSVRSFVGKSQVDAALRIDRDLDLAFGCVLHLGDGACADGIFDRSANGERIADLRLAEFRLVGAIDHVRGDKIVVELHQAFLGDDARGKQG